MRLPHVHKLTHQEALRIAGAIVLAAFVAEAGIAWHMFRAHDVLTGTLVVTAWLREHIGKFLVHVAESVTA